MQGYEYDIEGYSISEHVRRSINCYSLQEHEKKSLEEVQNALQGDASRKQLADYGEYLNSLETKFSTILITEEKEGLSNVQLRTELSFIRRLKEQIRARLEASVKKPLVI